MDAGVARSWGPKVLWVHLRRPDGLVEQARWLFWLGLLATLLVTLPGPVLQTLGSGRGWALAAAAVVLIAAWSARYLLRRAPFMLDVVEVAAIAAFAASTPDPVVVTPLIFAAFWFRALYGTTGRVFLFAALVATVLTLHRALFGPGAPTVPFMYSAVVASMFLNVFIARYLGLALFARENAQRRMTALSDLGQRLLGLTDHDGIHLAAQVCAATFVETTPGLAVLVVQETDTELTVMDHHGTFRRHPLTVPSSALPVARDASGPPADPKALAGLLAPGTPWIALAPADPAAPWVILGAPTAVLDEIITVFQSLLNQVALALRTSEAHRDLTLAANVDPLTGLANRAAFGAALSRALQEPPSRVALMFLDLDDFKNVNDGLGHAAGDELLRRVGIRLREAVRDDDLCVRLGGDEFAVLLVDADDTALDVAQRLVERVASPVSLNGRLAQVGASVGLAFSGPGIDGEQLVQHADIAMYAAKAKGKNRVQVFDPSLLRDDEGGAFEVELAAATAAGQLVVHYQPIVSVADGRCLAVEALVRWQHPTRGLLGPAEFIPAAERSGAIVEIGAHVMRTACADTIGWSRVGGELAVHVNVSVAQLTHPSFHDTVRRCIADFAMAPRQLVVEITESMVLDSTVVRAVLDRLIELGVAVAIDDFGTGYSALSTLRNLPLDIVKIDKSFVSGDPADVADQAVVEAVVQMARRLGLQVVAEGVERLDQQEFLRSVGADAAQGYLHLRPTTARRFEAWLARNTVESDAVIAAVTVLRQAHRR